MAVKQFGKAMNKWLFGFYFKKTSFSDEKMKRNEEQILNGMNLFCDFNILFRQYSLWEASSLKFISISMA